MKALAISVVLGLAVLVAPTIAIADSSPELTWYWTAKKARTELALDGVTARCHGKYDRFQLANDWYYRYFRCSGRAAGRFDLIVQGDHVYEMTATIDPDPAP